MPEAGTRFGPYQIVAPLGAGGMGEVYKALDTRLDRTVAVKVLPNSAPDLRERFDREARVVAALQHPHICTLLDVGSENGAQFLVMEYLEGETLRCPQPLAKVLEYGMQIAEALEAAHRKGVTHRDLKPANIMITKQGVKLLDFGIAKWNQNRKTAADDATLTQALTASGSLLGTLPYMAPEQLEGQESGARTDIWALGAVLYEMVTGKRAFQGKSQVSLMAAIAEHEPPAMGELQPVTPAQLERLVKRCLAKDPERRWQSALDVKLELETVGEAPRMTAAPRRRWVWGAAAAFLLAAGAGLGYLLAPDADAGGRAGYRFEVYPPPGTGAIEHCVVSPDGEKLLLAAGRQLWLRRLDEPEAVPLAGTEGANRVPFWSPDSRQVGFFARGRMWRVPASGGAAQLLGDSSSVLGAAWVSGEGGEEDSIIFVDTADRGLLRVPASGGTAREFTRVDGTRGETSHRSPVFVPEGRKLLYRVLGDSSVSGIYAVTLEKGGRAGRPQKISDETAGHLYSPSSAGRGSWLLFVRNGNLLAQPWAGGRAAEEAQSLASGVASLAFNATDNFSVSANGVLAYSGYGGIRPTRIFRLDRTGKQLGMWETNAHHLSVSPDEQKVFFTRLENASLQDVWLLDTTRGSLSRTTFQRTGRYPVWHPDGARLALQLLRGGQQFLALKPASGAGEDVVVYNSRSRLVASDWSPDGRFLALEVNHPGASGWDLMILDLAENSKKDPAPLVKTDAEERQAKFSPNGRWFAYESNETGRPEIYVQSFPPGKGKWQVSIEGGAKPVWRKDGRELYFISPNHKLMAVPVGGGEAFSAGMPAALFDTLVPLGQFGTQYAAVAGGQQFLVNMSEPDDRPEPVTVVVNWEKSLGKGAR